jgi:hypothetical protein
MKLKLNLNKIITSLYNRVFPCDHSWIYDKTNPAKRTCRICKEHQWMYIRSFPSETEPSVIWRKMQ